MPNKAKIGKVMREYKKGTLRSSSGGKVTKRKQAVAIAMSEAGMSKKRKSSEGASHEKRESRKEQIREYGKVKRRGR
jgi:hypothetical protein